MDIALRKEYESRMERTRAEAAKRGYEALIIIGMAPRRVGDLMYLCGHQPLLPGHPRRFAFRGRMLGNCPASRRGACPADHNAFL